VVSREALLWFRQAEANLRKALNDIVTRNWDSAAFRSQQATEKALKVLLLNAGIASRGRNLLELAEAARVELGVDKVVDDLRGLTVHYAISRYPNAANALPYELYTEGKARDLVERAKRVVNWVKQHLR